MGLPWVRLDANIGFNDKVVGLLAARDGHRAFTVYVCALGWAGGQGTDGFVPRHMLPMLHGRPRDAELLVEHRFWTYAEGGWSIHNYDERQELSVVSEMKDQARRRSSLKANCSRWHGPGCNCWKESA